LKAKTGRQIDVEFVSNLYVEGDRSVIQCNIRDVADRKQAMDQLRQLATDLSGADRRKKRVPRDAGP
jgi:hypothetical protein